MKSPITRGRREQPETAPARSGLGFTLLEMAATMAILCIMMAVALPQFLNVVRAYQLAGDARGVSGQLYLASLRAANNFTRARLHLNPAPGGGYDGTYQLQLYNQATSQYIPDGTASWNVLSAGVTFSTGQAQSAPPNSQTTMAETGDIVFNSRGIPVDPVTFAPIATDVIYVSSRAGTFAVSVSPAGQISTWQYSQNGWGQR